MSSSVGERQAEWQRARDRQTQLKAEALRSEESKELTFQPHFATSKRSRTSGGSSPQKACGLLAHDMHLRRYAKARDEKERAESALTRRRQLTAVAPKERVLPEETTKTNGDESTEEDEEETFFAQLQKERKKWEKEQAKLITVIELQQRELQQRGIRAEEKAREIATEFASTVAKFEERMVTIEENVANELASIRQLLERRRRPSDDQ